MAGNLAWATVVYTPCLAEVFPKAVPLDNPSPVFPKKFGHLSISPLPVRLISRARRHSSQETGMAAQWRVFQSAKSIAGTILVVLGTFILYENLAGAVAQLSQTLQSGSQTLGILPAVVLAASQPVQAYSMDHHRFLQDLFEHLLASSWPLLLVVCGSVLAGDVFRSKNTSRTNMLQRSIILPLCPTYRFSKSIAVATTDSNLEQL